VDVAKELENDEAVVPRKRTHRGLTVVALMLASALAAMEMTIVSTAMPTIVGELGGLPLYAWVASVYLLTSMVTVPLYGKLADLYGRKPILLIGTTLFLLGSVACALSRSMPMLIAARAFQGLGAGAMQPMSLTIVGDLFDLRERGRVQPWFGAIWGVAGLGGPLLGGLLVKHWSWPYVFWINIPFGIASMAIAIFALHENVARRRVTLDFAGAALLTGAVVALLVGIDGVYTWPLIALSIVLLVGFVHVERRATDPLVPLDLFTSRVIGSSNVLNAMFGGVMIGAATYVPLFVQGIMRGSPTEAGAAITPMLVSWPLAAFCAGRLIPRIGYRPFIRLGGVLAGISTATLPFVADATASPWALRGVAAGLGAGLGLGTTALLILVQSAVAWERRGIVTASNMFSRAIGSTLAVGAMGAILSNVVRAEAHVPPEVMQGVLLQSTRGAAAAASGISTSSLQSGQMTQLTEALAHGLSLVFWANAAIGGAAVLLGMLFPVVPATEKPDLPSR
jgi:EmrB/QacA subfamily drug resistance transporter